MNLAQLRAFTYTHLLNDVVEGKVRPDVDSDALWSTSFIDTLLNEAQRIFCQRTHALVDSDTPAATVMTLSGVRDYELAASILQIYSAHLLLADNTPYELTQLPSERFRVSNITAQPQYFTTKLTPRAVSFGPTPDDEYTVLLRVARLPAEMTRDCDEPEIPYHWHLNLCDWAAYRCLSVANVDDSDRPLSGFYRQRWDEAVRDANREQQSYKAPYQPLVIGLPWR